MNEMKNMLFVCIYSAYVSLFMALKLERNMYGKEKNLFLINQNIEFLPRASVDMWESDLEGHRAKLRSCLSPFSVTNTIPEHS